MDLIKSIVYNIQLKTMIFTIPVVIALLLAVIACLLVL